MLHVRAFVVVFSRETLDRPKSARVFDTTPKTQYNTWNDSRRHKRIAALHAGNG